MAEHETGDAGPRMPLGVRVLMGFGAVFAAAAPVVLGMAALGRGELGIAGRTVPAETWLRVAGPVFALAGVLLGAASYGLARRRAWARRPVMALWPALAAYALAGYALGALWPAAVAQTVAEAVVFGAAAWWYLYRKPNVRAYFEAPRARG